MKLREHEAIRSKSDAFRVDPRLLKIEAGLNVRDLDAPAARDGLDMLKESVRIEGVQVPVEIRMVGADIFIVSGHRRHKVVMELIAEGVEIDSIPATAEAKTVSDAERVARLITLNSGEPLSSLEKAEVVRRLVNYGWDREKIKARLGFKTVQTIANYELLLGAPEDVRQAVREGELSASSAVEMVRSNGAAASTTLATARKTATAKGKSRITKASMPNTPKKETPHNQAAVDRALNLLAGVLANDYPASVAASVYGAQPIATVSLILDWMTTFEDRLRDRINVELPSAVTTAESSPPDSTV